MRASSEADGRRADAPLLRRHTNRRGTIVPSALAFEVSRRNAVGIISTRSGFAGLDFRLHGSSDRIKQLQELAAPAPGRSLDPCHGVDSGQALGGAPAPRRRQAELNRGAPAGKRLR
jgi:hypothetical protein